MITIDEIMRCHKTQRSVYSPTGAECIIHEAPSNIYSDVFYQIISDVWPDEPEGDNDRIRTMDAYTFCTWFSLESNVLFCDH